VDHLPLLVIVGAPRSGTNVLRDVLTALPGLGTWPCDEINPIWRHGNSGHPTDELEPAHATERVRRYLRRTFARAHARYAGPGGILVEKTCATSLRVPFVDAVFPEARYVQIVRDGRDATASIADRWTSSAGLRYIVRKARFVPPTDVLRYAGRFVAARLRQRGSRDRRLPTWGPRFEGIDDFVRSEPLIRVCARQWAQCVTQSSDALEAMPSDRWLRVHYEELARHPREIVSGILEWLGPPVQATAAAAVDPAVAQVRGGRSGIWNERVTATDMEVARDVVQPAMARLEYAWSEA